jgi:hypothetical protein
MSLQCTLKLNLILAVFKHSVNVDSEDHIKQENALFVCAISGMLNGEADCPYTM